MENLNDNFEEIYNKVYLENNEKLKTSNQKGNMVILGIFIACIIINIFIYFNKNTRFITMGTIALSFCLLLIFIIIKKGQYSKVYKDCIIASLAKAYNERLYYDRQIGITQMEYKMAHFDNYFDRYFSEDRIYGTLKSGANIQIAEIATFVKEKVENSDNSTQETERETYRGMFGIVRLEKNICTSIFVSADSMFNRFSKDRIEIDSSEFEKYFDCSAEDRIVAMRIFTSDLIEKYIDIRKNFNYDLQLKIEEDKIYFRYKCGKMFEPPAFSSGLDRDRIKKYYDLIVLPLEIIEQTVKNINEITE